MLFNSLEFAVFLPVVFLLYWFVFSKTVRLQNAVIIASGYVFYGWWDWRFLLLLIFTSTVDFVVGAYLSKTEDERRRKILLLTSIFMNIGLLGVFKYYNFFVDSFIAMFGRFGIHLEARTLSIILPVGISFYTFQALSYTIDVYRRRIPATLDFLQYMAFISFFPQLLAGPIERASHMLPQFSKRRVFDYEMAREGIWLVIWGLFKKVVIADNCSVIVNRIFTDYEDQSGFSLVLGAVFFAFQIYGDFSGYSDIAIGTARFFGFELMTNFRSPYFSRDIAEFWRRWHISLTTWFRDYVYIPLGGSKVSRAKVVRNTMIVFLVSGFWHGANWTFIVWGALNAIYFLPLLLLGKNRSNTDGVAEGRMLPSVREVFQMATTFALVTVAWIFFRSETVYDAFNYISRIFTAPFFAHITYPYTEFFLLCVFIVLEWINRNNQFVAYLQERRPSFQMAFQCFILLLIVCFRYTGEGVEFIYFQF